MSFKARPHPIPGLRVAHIKKRAGRKGGLRAKGTRLLCALYATPLSRVIPHPSCGKGRWRNSRRPGSYIHGLPVISRLPFLARAAAGLLIPFAVPFVIPSVIPFVIPFIVPFVIPFVAPPIAPLVLPLVFPPVAPLIVPLVLATVVPVVVPRILVLPAPLVAPPVPLIAILLPGLVFQSRPLPPRRSSFQSRPLP